MNALLPILALLFVLWYFLKGKGAETPAQPYFSTGLPAAQAPAAATGSIGFSGGSVTVNPKVSVPSAQSSNPLASALQALGGLGKRLGLGGGGESGAPRSTPGKKVSGESQPSDTRHYAVPNTSKDEFSTVPSEAQFTETPEYEALGMAEPISLSNQESNQMPFGLSEEQSILNTELAESPALSTVNSLQTETNALNTFEGFPLVPTEQQPVQAQPPDLVEPPPSEEEMMPVLD